MADISSTRTDLPVDPVDPVTPGKRRQKLPKVSGLGTVLALAWTVIIVLGALIVDFLPLAEARDPALALTVPSMLPPDLTSDFHRTDSWDSTSWAACPTAPAPVVGIGECSSAR